MLSSYSGGGEVPMGPDTTAPLNIITNSELHEVLQNQLEHRKLHAPLFQIHHHQHLAICSPYVKKNLINHHEEQGGTNVRSKKEPFRPKSSERLPKYCRCTQKVRYMII